MNQGNEKETEIKQLEIISELLLPDWKKRLSEGKKLRDLVDPDELCGVKNSKLEMKSKFLSEEHFADLKNRRLYWKTKFSVQKRKDEPIRLEREVTALKREKQRLIKDRDESIKEIKVLRQKMGIQ